MLEDIIRTIKDNNTIWVMENKENSDKIFTKYISDKLFSSTYTIVSNDIAYIFVHKLDEGNIDTIKGKNYKVYVYTNMNELYTYMLEVLKILDFPQKILLSYNLMDDSSTDIISHSCYMRITKIFKKLYKLNYKKLKVDSAQMNIYELMSQYTTSQIEKLKILANITDEILKLSLKNIKINQTEIEIANNTQKIAFEYLEKIKTKYQIIEYDMAWDICPIVLVGENLEKGGHAKPSNKKIKRGDTIYFDFGVKAVFKTGEVLYTDMQRMGYFLREQETFAPSKVQEVFDTLVLAISNGIDKMKEGIPAYKIDKAVRETILKKDYPDYPHATGHPVGVDVHGAGALISTNNSKRAKLKLASNYVYTLEPRVNIKNGGSIEEMILVTKEGAVPLCKRQMQLYLLK